MTMETDVGAELAIRNSIARMAHTVDRGAVEDYAPMLAPDTRWIMPGGDIAVGPEAIMEGVRGRRAAGSAGPGSATRHIITTTMVEVDGDTARSWSYWIYVRTGTQDPAILLTGLYTDTFRRTEAGWLFAERISTLE